MSEWSSPWDDPNVAEEQRRLVDTQIGEMGSHKHFAALAAAVRAAGEPCSILELGCGSGYGCELLERSGVGYKLYAGIDISRRAIELARERYPADASGNRVWTVGTSADAPLRSVDLVIDGCCIVHVEDWRAQIQHLCAASRRWLVLHRVPLAPGTVFAATAGYGKSFPAWKFAAQDLEQACGVYGFSKVTEFPADGGSVTMLFVKQRQWATYFDSRYMARGKAMLDSLQRHGKSERVHVLCWDESTLRAMSERSDVHATSIDAFLTAHPDLDIGKLPGPIRSRAEHMWTVGPAFLAETMRQTEDAVTYVDADVYFHASPEPIFVEIGDSPAGVIPHWFAPRSRGLPGPTIESHSVFGTFNVGIVPIRNVKIAEDWATRCRIWCYDRIAQDSLGCWLYGDQAYLNDWPRRHDARVVSHPGACLGPWAIHTRELEVRDGIIYFGAVPLISYHYSSFWLGPHGHEQLTRPEYQITRRQAEIIYVPYIKEITS